MWRDLTRVVCIPCAFVVCTFSYKDRISFSDSSVHSQVVYLEKYRGQTVLFKNKKLFDLKCKKFMDDGPQKLQVITDFDYTLTIFRLQDERSRSTHAVAESIMPKEAQKRMQKLGEFYYPMEISSSLDINTKSEMMHDWATKSHNILVESKVTRQDIILAVQRSFSDRKIALRQGVERFFRILEDENVPVLVFSAGIGDVVEELLRQGLVDVNATSRPAACIEPETGTDSVVAKVLPKNIHIMSNQMIYSGPTPTDYVTGFDDLIFHVFNKKCSSIPHSTFLQIENNASRCNLLLVGDSLGDPYMSDGVDVEADSIIKIGFLNDHMERMSAYVDAFDVVILGDPSFDIVTGLVEDIATSTTTATAAPSTSAVST